MPHNPFELPSIEIALATEQDIDSVIELMQKNLKENLTAEQQRTQGFLSIDFPRSMLEEVVRNPNEGITIAKENGVLVGFLMPITMEHGKQFPIIDASIAQIKDATYDGRPINDYRCCILGQVCVENNHRGKGINETLYASMRERLADIYDLGISGIEIENTISMSAHLKKIGLTVVGEYSTEGENWKLVVYDFRK